MTGRLIEADKLETHEQLEGLGNGMYEYVKIVYKDDIDVAPTIAALVGIEPEKSWSGNNMFDGNFERI